MKEYRKPPKFRCFAILFKAFGPFMTCSYKIQSFIASLMKVTVSIAQALILKHDISIRETNVSNKHYTGKLAQTYSKFSCTSSLY